MNNKDLKKIRVTENMGTKRYGLTSMIECAVFAAILCILSPIAVFIGPIPVTLQLFAVLFTAVVLGAKKAVITVGIYVLLGCFGIPVFSGAKAGAAVLLGPTGGYIVACIPTAFVMGMLCNIKFKTRKRELAAGIVAGLLSVCICYVCGTLWYAYVSNLEFSRVLAVCVFPFIPFDLIKIVCSVSLGKIVKRHLLRSRNF